jgi:AcrR family transcriptional regulator
MAKNKISEPKQRRSIEKKKKIVNAGFKLFCEKGFYKTNTAEIAREAGVSTGIVYRYFPDKKAIFLDCLPMFFNSIYAGVYIEIQQLSPPFDYENTLNAIIDSIVTAHSYSKDAHEEMMAMSHSDPDVKEYFNQAYRTMNIQLSEVLGLIGLSTDNSFEKIHIIIDMIESYCHEVVFERDERLDYGVLKEILTKGIESILNIC